MAIKKLLPSLFDIGEATEGQVFRVSNGRMTKSDTSPVFKDNGRMGLGTATPTSLFTIKSDENNTATSGFLLEADDSTNRVYQLSENQTGEGYSEWFYANAAKTRIRANGDNWFLNNVGIGTSAPLSGYALDVNGYIKYGVRLKGGDATNAWNPTVGIIFDAGTSTSYDLISVGNTANGEMFNVTGNGATTFSNPNNPSLVINRSVATGDAAIMFQSNGANVGKITGQTAGAMTFATGTEPATRLTITGAGVATFSDDLIVTGDLTVNGTTTTIDTTNLLIDDPLMLLARTQSGTPTLDSGLIIERGSSTNVGLIWDESADEFAFINTTDTATTAGNVTIASYANLHAGAGHFYNNLTCESTIFASEYIKHYGEDANYLRFTTSNLTISKQTTFSSHAIVQGELDVAEYLRHTADVNTQIRFEASQMTLKTSGGCKISLNNNENLYFYTGSSTTLALTLDTSQNATFSGTLNLTRASGDAQLFLTGSGTNNSLVDFNNATTGNLADIYANNSKQLIFRTNGATTALTLGADQAAAFTGQVRTSGQFRISADYAVQYWYKANNSTMLGYLLMRDNAANYLSTAGGQDFAIVDTTTNTRWITFQTSTKNVGIGTSAPVQKFHVLGDAIKFERTDNAVALQLYNNNASPADDAPLGYLQFMGKDNDGTASIVHSEVRGGVQSNTNSAVSGYLSFLTTNNGTAVTEAMRIKSDGKVGIGTTAPGAFLDVVGSEGSNWAASLRNTSTQSWGALIQGGADKDDYSLLVRDKDANDIFTIRGNGYVGIGNNSPNNGQNVTDRVQLAIGNTAQIGGRKTGTPSWFNISHGTYFDGTNWKYYSAADEAALVEGYNGGLYARMAVAGTNAGDNISWVTALTVLNTGYVHMDGASQVRLTLGSQGTAGNNDSNWIRGNGTSLGFNAAGGATTWEVSGAQKMSLSSTGALVIQDALTVNGNISNSAASTYFYLNNVGTGNSGMYIGGFSARMRFHVPASNYYEWEIGGSHKMRLDANGNLGIGTAAPAKKLDVNGTFRATGEVTFSDANTAIDKLADGRSCKPYLLLLRLFCCVLVVSICL